MLIPLSWLKEYVDTTLTPEKLGDKLTEIGLGCEKIIKTENDVIFELEITPNRPDLLSIVGVAREVAAIEKKEVKLPPLRQDFAGQAKLKKILPLTIKPNLKINPRFTGIIIDGVKVGESPKWLKDKLVKIGQRPINNIVDATNYVMFEMGNPIHAFDYDKIKGHTMSVHLTKGGEKFKSVDAVSYRLPKDAVVISDEEKIIDLCGIKGGYNSGTFEDTKTIFIRVPVEIPSLIRRASQSLGIRSEASSIFERSVNEGGTIDALKRCTDLILEIAGGNVASELYDLKEESFKPWKLSLRLERLSKILGIEIPIKQVLSILQSLNLSPKLSTNTIDCEIPTYRNDLKIEEDLIEEVARIYGYNNFPKTMPQGEIPTSKIPYFKDFAFEEKAKRTMTAAGFSEVYTYSLVSEKNINDANIKPDNTLRIDNPVSREFEYLRPTLKTNLSQALKLNIANFDKVSIFEIGKVYVGKTIENFEEHYVLSGISNSKSFYEVKGTLERLYEELSVDKNPTDFIEVLDDGIFFEINFTELESAKMKPKIFTPLPKYPPIVEDLSIEVADNVKTGEIIETIKKQSPLISDVSLIDTFENSRTFHIVYQSKQRNLTKEEVAEIREKIEESLKEKFTAS